MPRCATNMFIGVCDVCGEAFNMLHDDVAEFTNPDHPDRGVIAHSDCAVEQGYTQS